MKGLMKYIKETYIDTGQYKEWRDMPKEKLQEAIKKYEQYKLDKMKEWRK